MTTRVTIALVAALALGGCGKKQQDDKSPAPVATTKEPAKEGSAGSGSAAGSGGSAATAGSDAGSGAGSGSAGDVKPPSTGNEMPAEGVAMTKDQAMAVVTESIKLVAAGGDPPCDKIATALEVALPIAFPEPGKDAVDGIMAYGKCSAKTSRWRGVIRAGSALLQIAPDPKTPAQIVRALAEMGEYDKAIAAAAELAKKYPDARPMLTAAQTFVYCKAEVWDACVKSADASLAALAKQGIPSTDQSVLLNRVLRDLGWVVIGKPKEALADFKALDKETGNQVPAKVAAIKDEAQKAIDRGFYFDVVPISQLPIGVYHLMGRQDTGALVTLKLREHAGTARTFRVEVEVPGVTERSSNTIALKPHEASVRWANPPLKMDFDTSKIRSPRPSQLALKVVEVTKDGDKPVFDETLPIEVLPRDYLPLKRKVGADTLLPTYGYLGAWVMSNDKAIEEFLGKAKARLPSHAFVGEQDVTVPQIKAIFDELKSRGVSYVMDPNVTSDQAFVQRTRLPAEVLASTNAQCLEGTLLFATAFEAIGLKPIIVLVPGHAFVGWHTVPKDGTKGEPLFVETTMVGGYSFEQAVEVATKRVAKELHDGTFKSGAATMIDVEQIHKAGFTAQPM